MATGSSSEVRNVMESSRDDVFHLQNLNNLGMMLVSVPLNGRNYLAWRRSMVIALCAKDKMGFITGKVKKPSEDSPLFEKWKRADCMVIFWFLGAISKDLVDSFLYASSAKDLWNELEQQFGVSNRPLLYHVKHEISSLTQGNMSLMAYYTKLKKLWDELGCLKPMPVCTCEGCVCGAAKAIAEIDQDDKLIQFFMGLGDHYNHVRNQILLMDPLPEANKAYSLALHVEKQREIHVSENDTSENVAMAVKGGFNKKDVGSSKLRKGEKKDDRFCTYCNKSGHMMDACFKLHEYPDWFQELKQKKFNKVQAHVAIQD
ncbi:uncharacterized protein LOC110653516 [Hevea brasiliensis]|uniref:uncharacterized protein LOC110653516 n=1 Tax=Hevea brasiliensis TaxID=3981 RepID=UPI0025E13900|nr:uncharacterized protein LOC110653516 [Hevea brasiliensis]